MILQNRREFLRSAALSSSLLVMGSGVQGFQQGAGRKPNIVFIFADQWRAQATGYSGDPNLKGKTPNLDRLAGESVNVSNAVSTCPVCTPYRASMLTGQYPLTHGLFLNDKPLRNEAVTIAEVCKEAGYDTAYVGKWHIDGQGRSSYIPRDRRQGFDYWKVLECTHIYNNSAYYAGDDTTKRYWQGYDAIAQTRDVGEYIKTHAVSEKPFVLFLSWGPPHNPYHSAPERYRKLFDAKEIELRPNVPASQADLTRENLAGYYAHIAALDGCIGEIVKTIDEAGIKDDTILVFTSDHGDMMGSHGQQQKQRPYDESIRVPLLIRYPAQLGGKGKKIDMPLGTPDIMPTLLGLSRIGIPGTVEGTDYSSVLAGRTEPLNDASLIECLLPFGEWNQRNGGKEYRGIRTGRYTFVCDLTGPWLLFDNEKDPYQQRNLVDSLEYKDLQTKLNSILLEKLKKNKDAFKYGHEYLKTWNYSDRD
jgi:arylsulfatase A-like enzyme